MLALEMLLRDPDLTAQRVPIPRSLGLVEQFAQLDQLRFVHPQRHGARYPVDLLALNERHLCITLCPLFCFLLLRRFGHNDGLCTFAAPRTRSQVWRNVASTLLASAWEH